MVLELYPIKNVTFCCFSVVERERESRERESRESGTVTCHAYMFKCPGWKFVGKVWNFSVLLLDDVTSWWMFKWRSGALARAQIQGDIFLEFEPNETPVSECEHCCQVMVQVVASLAQWYCIIVAIVYRQIHIFPCSKFQFICSARIKYRLSKKNG